MSWDVRLLDEIEVYDLPAIQKSIRKHLKSKKAAQVAFEKAIAEVVERIELLQIGPDHPEADLEPTPPNSPQIDLRKIRFRFRIPELGRGAINYCRIDYGVFRERKTIVVLYVYTHAQYSKRPSDHELKERLKRAAKLGRV